MNVLCGMVLLVCMVVLGGLCSVMKMKRVVGLRFFLVFRIVEVAFIFLVASGSSGCSMGGVLSMFMLLFLFFCCV